MSIPDPEYFLGVPLWIFGMSLNILGSIMVNFGTNLMKSAHNIVRDQKSSSITSPAGERYSVQIWRVGMAVFVIGSLVNFASFAFAAQSLLAALGTVQFVSNVIFAKCVLKEQLSVRIIIATTIIVFGLTVSIKFSNHASEVYTVKDLMALYSSTYLIFLGCVFGVLLILHLVYLKYTKAEEEGSELPMSDIIRPATYSIVSATVGTQSVLQSKCIAELVKATIKGENQFDQWFLYVILLVFIFGLGFWLHRMNAALQKFDGLIIIPLLQVFWTTSAILQGGVYFREFEKFSPLQTVGFCLGVLIVFFGVFLLTPNKRKDDSGSDRALINSEGGPGCETDDSDDSACSVSNGGSASELRNGSTFTNCGLSTAGSTHGQPAVERLLSLTYMPVVLNDANIAFYMDRALISKSALASLGTNTTTTTSDEEQQLQQQKAHPTSNATVNTPPGAVVGMKGASASLLASMGVFQAKTSVPSSPATSTTSTATKLATRSVSDVPIPAPLSPKSLYRASSVQSQGKPLTKQSPLSAAFSVGAVAVATVTVR